MVLLGGTRRTNCDTTPCTYPCALPLPCPGRSCGLTCSKLHVDVSVHTHAHIHVFPTQTRNASHVQLDHNKILFTWLCDGHAPSSLSLVRVAAGKKKQVRVGAYLSPPDIKRRSPLTPGRRPLSSPTRVATQGRDECASCVLSSRQSRPRASTCMCASKPALRSPSRGAMLRTATDTCRASTLPPARTRKFCSPRGLRPDPSSRSTPLICSGRSVPKLSLARILSPSQHQHTERFVRTPCKGQRSPLDLLDADHLPLFRQTDCP